LVDIRKLGSLNQKQDKALRTAVQSLFAAEQAKKDFETAEHKLQDAQYVLMETNQKFVPDEIRLMGKNEDDRYKMKREIHVLEAQKSEREIDRENNIHFRETMRKLSIMLLAASGSMALFFIVIQLTMRVDMTWATLLLLFFMALFVMYVFLKNSRIRRENREAVDDLNQIISMLNVLRMRYASLTAAIDFMKRKYGIRTSYELKGMWDSFLEERQIRLKNRQDNEDYKYYYHKLVKILGELNLRDTNIWVDQTEALVNEDEMQKVKSSLMASREKLRTRMEDTQKMIKDERDEITQVMREHDFYPPDLVEIIASVDKKCGLNVNYYFRKK
ncbi:MAG: hypothetical protein IJ679_00160, partial [Lachnospiraceae bacterium]|nr:hypothetical protein [Lachnospiraceae bacterium]